MRESSIQICPVPTEQQPVIEYESLKESWFFRWATLEKGDFWRKIAWIWGIGWVMASPIAAASFPPEKRLLGFTLASNLGAGLILGLILLQLYLGWRYVSDRLSKETIFYEESGWYDGQTWPKPPEMLTRDRLIVSYQVAPILQRLIRTTGILALLMMGDSMVWLCL
ncbi:CGLD27 family protein [Crocosphaera sp. UHCC 0190]|uniref:CGLD27 family protein n=1 Tax=Crocosphaera sp. UHCC 0190 TaxID=3110246 RepID=UPI002B21E63A|nr:CGLD27 family protein [Crocosphaera sp. UHCC 0190]MEA5510100.1 CGLD27 family protein [Crocosphaera sp. UHCC 0190]